MTEERFEGAVHSTKIFLSGMGVGLSLGAVIGALAGVLAGFLVAPKPGKEMREELKEKAEEFIESGKEAYESKRGKILEAVEREAKVGYEKVDKALKKKIEESEKMGEEA